MNCPAPSFASLATAKSSLARHLRNLLGADLPALAARSPRLLRLEVPVADCTPLQWLSWQNHPAQCYWSGRHQDFEAAGIGCADRIRCNSPDQYDVLFATMRRNLRGHDGRSRYYGGLRFNPQAAFEAHWSPYGTAQFVLPQFEVVADADGTWFACNLLLGGGHVAEQRLQFTLKALEQVRDADPEWSHGPGRIGRQRQDIPERAEWLEQVSTALAILDGGEFAKIVLGRSTLLQFDVAPGGCFLLGRLKEVEPSAYHFYFQPEPGNIFIGATPERLYRRCGDGIRSEAVAGTRARGRTPEEDGALSAALLSSEKEFREHKLVREDIRSVLAGYCRELAVGAKPRLRKLARVQHLCSPIEGRLREGVSDLALVQALHPTPAVGGLPRSSALAEIERLEPFDRGWFAGPIGWIGAQGAEFVVGIRSAILTAHSLRLFAGAGIVEGSVPEAEWEETENKLRIFMDALGIQPR